MIRSTRAIGSLPITASINPASIARIRSAEGGKGVGGIGFHLDTYRIDAQAGGSSRMRIALEKLPESRTLEDCKALQELVRGLPGFSKYSESVRKDLGRVLGYERFGAGRTVIKQNHFAMRFYYIMSGECEVLKLNQEGKNRWIGYMGPGKLFGEVGLMVANSRRTATVVTTKVS
ncbi:hypothetical protein HDU98_007539 [Podochytrium sp. JEL0797]|nr:hypothetical protein HDU98_007539 [Podochytrium sp. JEL0797]